MSWQLWISVSLVAALAASSAAFYLALRPRHPRHMATGAAHRRLPRHPDPLRALRRAGPWRRIHP